MGKGKKIAIIIPVAVIGFFIYAIFAGGAMITEEKQVIANLSDNELHSKSIAWTYPALLRNIDDYDDEIIYFKGSVTSSQKNLFGIVVGNSNVLQISEDDIIFVEYDKGRFLVNDRIEGFGYVDGLRYLQVTKSFSGAVNEELVPNIEGIRITCTSC